MRLTWICCQLISAKSPHHQLGGRWNLYFSALILLLCCERGSPQILVWWGWWEYEMMYFSSNKILLMKFINFYFSSVQFSLDAQLVRLFATPWIAARQASLSIIISRSSLKLTSIESVMPSSHLILCRPLFLLPPIPPSLFIIFININIIQCSDSIFL